MRLSDFASDVNVNFLILIYGLSFFVISIGILVKRREIAHFGLTDSFLVLAIFGVFHGVADLMPLLPRLVVMSAQTTDAFRIAKLLVSILSFQFLFYFAFIELTSSDIRLRWFIYLSPFVIGLHYLIAANMLQNVNVAYQLTAYLLAMPGSLLAGLGFVRLSARFRALEMPHLATDLLILAAVFVVFGILKFWPVYSGFGVFGTWGLVILILRTAAALVSAFFVVRVLGAFRV